MHEDDQKSFLEAMEQGRVTISKAVSSTLPAQTSILAAGNPKLTRFDDFAPIAKQIALPDTLLTRFDLKFIIKDKGNKETDLKIARHIFAKTENLDSVKPVIDPQLLRKYIAYAKEKCAPVLSDKSKKSLESHYVHLRESARQQNAAVPIATRQHEALIRLAKASARIRLQDEVGEEDVKRAIRLMNCSLEQLGLDIETGMIDIDKAEGATPHTERNAVKVVREIIDELAKIDKEVSVDTVIEQAEKAGVANPEKNIEDLKDMAVIFEVSPGYIRKL